MKEEKMRNKIVFQFFVTLSLFCKYVLSSSVWYISNREPYGLMKNKTDRSRTPISLLFIDSSIKMKIPITKILTSSLLLSYISTLALAEEIEDQVCKAGDETCAPQEAAVDVDSSVNVNSIGIDNGDDDDDTYDEDGDDDDDDHYEEEEEEEDSDCVDTHNMCAFWAKEGECQNNPGYMLNSCRKSCNTCNVNVPAGLGSGYGEPQKIEGVEAKHLWPRLEKMDKYMSEEIIKPEYDKVRAECKNRNELCLFWAHIGECDANPNFMLINCAPACETCKNIDFNYRCPMDPDEKNVFGPGDLHKMFERIVDEYGDNVTILSKPPTEEGAEFTPWAITVDNFISDEECESLIELGGLKGYERSTDVGKMKFDGTYEAKTSRTRTSEVSKISNAISIIYYS